MPRFPLLLSAVASTSLLFTVAAGAAPAATTTTDAAAPDALTTVEQRAGYSLGADFGRRFQREKIDVDIDALLRGVRDGYQGGELHLTEQQMQAAITALKDAHDARLAAERDALGKRNQAEADAFLAKNAKARGVQQTASGVQYRVVTKGKGAKPAKDDNVRVKYRGTLLDGTEFDSTATRGGTQVFEVARLMPAWTEILQLMPVGSRWTVYVPPRLGYGANSFEKIGPNSLLTFDIELLSIEPKTAVASTPASN